MHPDDERLGQLLRAIRRRTGQTQAILAKAAGVPRVDVLRIEAGDTGLVALGRVRRIFEAAGGRLKLNAWFNGATADRLLDEKHARLIERAAGVLVRREWLPLSEVTFSEFGERGSIDILGCHERLGAIAVCEVKSALGSLEETNRMLDVKERLAPKIAFDRLGWRPRVVGRILIVPDEMTVRRTVERHSLTMASVYPARSREVRAWLRNPVAPMRGIWFLSDICNSDMSRG